MDIEPPLIKNHSHDLDSVLFDNQSDQISLEDEDPYSFSSTSTSLIGLAIVFVMLGIPLLAVINDSTASKKSILPTSINKNGPKSSSPFTIARFSKYSS